MFACSYIFLLLPSGPYSTQLFSSGSWVLLWVANQKHLLLISLPSHKHTLHNSNCQLSLSLRKIRHRYHHHCQRKTFSDCVIWQSRTTTLLSHFWNSYCRTNYYFKYKECSRQPSPLFWRNVGNLNWPVLSHKRKWSLERWLCTWWREEWVKAGETSWQVWPGQRASLWTTL